MSKSLVFLIIILTAIFGAGVADMVTEVVPIRPYTIFFQTYSVSSMSQNSNYLPMSFDNGIVTSILIISILAIISLFLAYHVVAIIPLGARGSHSRANRRANAGWKHDQRENVREQFKVLREIFGDPHMIMIYGSEDRKKRTKRQEKPEE